MAMHVIELIKIIVSIIIESIDRAYSSLQILLFKTYIALPMATSIPEPSPQESVSAINIWLLLYPSE